MRGSDCCGLLLAGFLVCLTAGCDSSEPPDTTQKTPTSAAAGQETEAERCRKKLAAAIRRLQPENFATLTRGDRAVNGLNAWLASCAAEEVGGLSVSDATLEKLDPDSRRLVTAARYTASDAVYVRDALLLRRLSDALIAQLGVGDASSVGRDTDRVVGMFRWVVRNVGLLPDDEQRVPLGLFDVLLTGRGTAQDRAWIFAELLRQRQIDTVILTASGQPQSQDRTQIVAAADWLLAVMVDENVLLFDAVTGSAVAASDSDQVLVDQPAGLDLLADSERWQQPGVQVIAQSSAFAPRMLVLQEQLAAEDSAVLYEELTGGTSEIRPLVQRILNRGDGLFAAERITVWPYPDERAAASGALPEQLQAAYTDLMRPFDAPFEREAETSSQSVEDLSSIPEALSDEEKKQLLEMRLMDEFARTVSADSSSENLFGKPSGRLRRTRIEQIGGSNDLDIIQQLQQIRIASTQEQILIRVPEQVRQQYGYPEIMPIPLPPKILEVNQSATSDTLYWTAMVQISRNEDGAAITTLGNYLRSYPDGKRYYAALINQALAQLRQGRMEAATETLQQANQPENPEQLRVQLLLKRLQAYQSDAS